MAKNKEAEPEEATVPSEDAAGNTTGGVGLTEGDFAETRKITEDETAAREQYVKDHTMGEVQPVITTEEMKHEAKYAHQPKAEKTEKDEG